MFQDEHSTESAQGTPRASTVRTAAATAGKMRAAEERAAARLRARGWVCVPPDHPAIEHLGDFLDDCIAIAEMK